MAMVGIGVSSRVALGRGRYGFASSFDTNQDGSGEMVIQLTPGAVGGREGPLVNATTFGDETPDYAASLVNVSSRDLSLDALTDPEEGFLYDYYEGRASTDPGPDEAWVVVDPSESGGQGRRVLFRKLEDSRGGPQGESDDDEGRDDEGRGNGDDEGRGNGDDEGRDDDEEEGGEWRTRNVGDEIAGGEYSAEGLSLEGWREFDIDDQSIADVSTNDLTEEFEDGATVEWVGIGRGSPGWKSFVADTYYDDVVVAGEEVLLPVTDQRRGGPERGQS
jgi:hypothetical protein